MSLALSILENVLGLTDDEKQRVELALPYIKLAVDAVNTRIDTAWSLDQMLVKQQPFLKRVVDDYRIIGPNLSALLGDNWVDVPGTIAAVQDIQAAMKTFPTSDLLMWWDRLLPVVNAVFVNWPKIAPAVKIILAAANRRGVTMGNVLGKLEGTLG